MYRNFLGPGFIHVRSGHKTTQLWKEIAKFTVTVESILDSFEKRVIVSESTILETYDMNKAIYICSSKKNRKWNSCANNIH